MGVTRQLIKWCDNTFEDSLHENDERKSMRKATASGFVEGLVDGAVVMYIPVLIACYVYKAKAEKK